MGLSVTVSPGWIKQSRLMVAVLSPEQLPGLPLLPWDVQLSEFIQVQLRAQ